MKTFTNLIKRASLSTFNMKRYYLFIIMLLTLGIGTAWAAEYALYSGTITEGDYVIVYDSNAMNNTVSSSRLGNTTVTITDDKISNPDATIVWHIAPSGDYWTIFSANANKYAASTGAKNKAQLLGSGTDDKSLWTVSGSSTYEFVNKANAAANVNKNLRQNGTYGFACYATSTGGALSLYKKVEQSGGGETPDPEPEPDPEEPTPGTGDDGSYTWDLSKESYSAASTNQVTWSATDVNMVVDKANATTNANNYLPTSKTSSRFYQNSILTITPSANVTITSVVFTATSESYANALKGSTWTNASASVSSKTVTVTPTNGASAISAKIGGTCGFTGVTVHYTKVASGEPEPVIVKTLKSIAVTGMKTTYEQGDLFGFEGTCTATYSVTKGDVAQADETVEVTPTSVSTPDMNQVGTQTITVTYETVSTTYDITITENEVTAGTYDVLLNNVLWNVTAGQQAASVESMAGKSNDITFYTTKGSSQMYASATQTRFYASSNLVISVPAGYVIKSITFTEPTSDKKWDGSITVNTGTYTDGTKSWSGSAQEVQFSFAAQNRIANASITYEALDLTIPATPTFTPAAGTYNAVQNVTISAEEGTTIYYTLDGNDPTTESKAYSSAIEIGETTTVKAIAVKDEKVSLVASATYTINLPLTTMDQIFEKATAVGNTATSVEITFDNWVVTGVKSSNAYVTDGTKGLIIYKSSHGFVVGDVLSGTVACKVQLYNGSSELTELTKTTEGLTVTTGGTVTPVEVTDITTLGGVNTGSVITITGTCESGNVVAGAKLYGTLYTFDNLTVGNKYNVTGVYLQYGEVEEILPRKQEDIEEVQDLATATIAIADITMEVGEEKDIEATITPDAAQTKVQYAITAGSEYIDLDGTTITAVAAGTATITATIAEVKGEYYGTTKTFNVTVKPQNIAVLPFTFDGGKTDIENTLGMSQTGLDDDYGSAPKLKFNGAGDNVIVHFDSQAGEFSFVLKQNGQNAGTFTVYESANGEDYTPIWSGGNIGNTKSETITPTLAESSRYVKFEYTTKGEGTNYALGSISIAKPDLRQEAGIAWSAEITTITIGDALTAPTLSNPHSVAVTFESSNDAVATVSTEGVIALVEDAIGTATITATFVGDANYKPASATCTIKVKRVQEDCGGSDDFATATAANPTSYNSRTTEAGWSATNAAVSEIEGDNYLTINGKVSNPGSVINSPTLTGGIGSIKIRYANIYKEDNGVSFRLNIWKNDQVVKTYDITKTNAEVDQNTVYTETIENINVAGEFKMQFINLCPSNNSTSNKDRVSIGRLCWTGYNSYTITATANPTEGGTVTGTGTYVAGTNITLIATPAEGYEFVEWTKEGMHVSDKSTCSFEVTADVELVANFQLKKYTISANAFEDVGGNVTGTGTYKHGDQVTLTATADEHYKFYQWRKKGEEDRYSKDNPLSFKATEDVELVADFILVQRIVKVTAENGTVTAASGLVISKEASYPHGTVAKLTATPADHYVFVSWTKGEEVVSTEPTYTFTITEDVELVANFALDTHTVAVTAENGTVSGAGSYTHGTEVTLTATANTGYEFVNWTKGDEKVSTNATYTFIATEDITLAANFAPVVIPPTLVTPSVESGIFSVGEGKYVQFSTGNLQYEVGTNTWSFAEEQYEVIGGAAYDPANPTNTNYGMNEPGYTGKLDLFGWSSDGKFGVNPSNADADYTDAFVDWGKLVDGENWYTLTASEMHYLLSRKKDDKKLWATAELDGKVVLILLPDNWDTTTNLAYGYVPATGNFEENVLDIDTWKTLEKKGAVLLPSGGSRTGGYGNKIGFDGETEETDDTRLDANGYYFHVNNVGDYGYYWLNTPTSSEDCVDCAAYLITPGFIENDPTKTEDDQYTSPQVPSREKRRGNSVRLVKKIPAYTITTTAEHGTVTGAGTYPQGAEVTLTADPAMDHTFVSWTKGGEVVSTANPYVFIASKDLELVANFAEISQTSKTLTGEFSVGQYEVAQFATGNLQYNVKDKKWSFAKQQYQYIGDANINVGDSAFTGTIDLFGWSNGDANNFGVNPSANKDDYAGDFVDWGTLFPADDNWSTLTKDQWNYLLNQRGAGKKQIARVGTVFGVMLFPDEWTMPSGISVAAQYDSYFKVNVYNYTLNQWTELENAGALFMPAAGRRFGGYGNTYRADGITNIGEEYKLQYCTNDFAAYWTSTKNDDGTKVNYLLNLGNKGAKYSTLELGWVEYGHAGHSVRLAKVTNTLIEIGDGDNSDVITDNKDKVVNVKVNRTFKANDGYYTICLPFNLDASEIGTAYQISSITEHVEGEGLNVNFTTATTLEAGQPYLVLPSKDLTNPVFENVTIVNTTGNAATEVTGAGIKVAFTGIINGGGTTNGTSEYWVGNGGYLYNDATAKLGLRAFFTITDEEGNPAKVRARVVIGENPTTGFENITTTDKAVKIIENGQLIIIRNGEKFNAQGVKF